MRRRKREERDLVGIGVERPIAESLKVRRRKQEIVAKNDRAKTSDGGGKLCVGIVFGNEPVYLPDNLGVDRFTVLPAVFERSRKRPKWRRSLIRFAEGDVKGRDSRPVLVKGVEQCCKIRSEEHTSELQSRLHLVCRLLLEKKKNKDAHHEPNTYKLARHTDAGACAPPSANA